MDNLGGGEGPPIAGGQVANTVLGKARSILECFDIDDDAIALTEISRRTGIPKGTVHRLARELLDWGMLERSGVGYRLGMRAFELGARVPRMRVLREVMRPHMERLHFTVNETVHLAIQDGLEVMYVEKVNDQDEQTKPSRIAGRMPLHSTATGKILVAFGPRGLLDAVIDNGLVDVTPSTLVDPRLFREQIALARKFGFVTEHEETVVGYTSTAVPLTSDNGTTLAALSITAPKERADHQRYAGELLALSSRLATEHRLN